MNKLQRVKEALESIIHSTRAQGSCSLESMGAHEANNTAKEALAEFKEFMDRLESEDIKRQMVTAYSLVLIDLPIDDRYYIRAMEAAINVIKGEE